MTLQHSKFMTRRQPYQVRKVAAGNLHKRLDWEQVVVGPGQLGGRDKSEAADMASAGQINHPCFAAGTNEAAALHEAVRANKGHSCGPICCPLGEAHAHLWTRWRLHCLT